MAAEPAAAPPGPARADATPPDVPTILVVDDEDEVRAMLFEYLSGRGYAVVAAEDARAMFTVLESRPVDVVLLDRTMPGGDAMHLIPALRSRFDVGVILVTALSTDGDRVTGLETGADDYVCKPFNPRELAARIQTLLRRASARPKALPAPRSPEAADRRMAAVLCADVAGYVRLMNQDETGTMRALWDHRRELIDPTLAAHGGRLVKNTGDGFFAEFRAVSDACTAALAIQAGMTARNTGVAAGRRMQFRMGVNWCRVVADRDDIYGDGVNIAQRLQTLAEPGGICVSQLVADALREDDGVRVEAMGERHVKNISEPIAVFRLRRRD
ncbi:MAG: response regulator [Rhodospirillales bacterium]|nr:MAG: response regulator [Rhodospirillales bacterium]